MFVSSNNNCENVISTLLQALSLPPRPFSPIPSFSNGTPMLVECLFESFVQTTIGGKKRQIIENTADCLSTIAFISRLFVFRGDF